MIIQCEACDGEGRIVGNWWLHSGECPYCDGTGGEFIEGQPIDLEDSLFLAGGRS